MKTDLITMFKKITRMAVMNVSGLIPKGLLIRTAGMVAIGERVRPLPLWVSVDAVGFPDYHLELQSVSVLPFASESLRVIYTSHTLEHLSESAVESVLIDCFRQLRHGGELLIDLPDCQKAFHEMRKIGSGTQDSATARYLQGLSISAEAISMRVPTHFDSKADVAWANDPLNLIHNCAIASYLNPPLTGSHHVPVLIDPEVLRKKVKSMSLDSYLKLSYEWLPKGFQYSGGHSSGWYPEKLIKLLAEIGFDACVRSHKESACVPPFLVPDRHHREVHSFKISARKPKKRSR